MIDLDTNPLIVKLNRPQYVANPDLLLVALANRVFSVPVESKHALIYQDRRTEAGAKAIKYVETFPGRPGSSLRDDAHFDGWVTALETAGIHTDSESQLRLAARGIANSMTSVVAGKARSIGALPISAQTSLLQDPRGVVGVMNPPDYALILEQLFCLGIGPVASASDLWTRAVEHRVATDSFARAIDQASGNALLPAGRTRISMETIEPSSGVGEMMSAWANEKSELNNFSNPMIWFTRRWREITDPAWVGALPARRWVDWASTVLRHAIAFGFLWEARYYRRLAEACFSQEAEIDESTFRNATNSHRDLLRWRDTGLAPSVRALATRREVIDGMRAREFFSDLDSSEIVDGDPVSTLQRVSKNEKLLNNLRRSLASDKAEGSTKNVWEAIRYSLLVREPTQGDPTDHYGLVRGTRWLVPEPGAEWIVVMASLTAGVGGSTTVGKVMSDLNSLGIDMSLPELLRLVEVCGLAELTADADQAVIVDSAFGKG